MRHIKFILIFVILISTYFVSYSQPAVRVSDATAPRGESTLIDVTGTIDFGNTGELVFYFTFNAYLYDIKSVKTGNNFGLNTITGDGFKVIINPMGLSELIVKSNDYKNISNGILFRIELEGLAYKDSIGFIIPDSVALNGTKVNNLSLNRGRIVVPGLPIYDDFGEGLGYCYPNPFHYTVTLPFYLESSQNIKLNVFSLAGKRIPIHEINMEQNRLFKKETNGTKVPLDNIDSELSPGYYEYVFTPEYWEMSSGIYYVFLITNDKVYSKSLIFFKP
jgi:hypothetical protein